MPPANSIRTNRGPAVAMVTFLTAGLAAFSALSIAVPAMAQFPPNQFPGFVHQSSGIPDFMVVIFVLMGVMVFGSILVKIVSSTSNWVDNSSQPVETKDATIVSKRVEVSGSHNSTSTDYFVTFELPGGIRQEFKVGGSNYGQLAEGDSGKFTHQGTDFMNFERVVATEPDPPAAPPVAHSADRVCAYCGSAIPGNSLKCDGCGWTWRPPTNSPVES